MCMNYINPAYSYASLARDEAAYQDYLDKMHPEHEDFFDDEGVLIDYGDFYVETDQCVLANSSIRKLANSTDLNGFLQTIYGEDVEIPEWASEYFEDGDYTGILFEMDKISKEDTYKTYEY